MGIKIVGYRLAILKCAELLNKDAKPQTTNLELPKGTFTYYVGSRGGEVGS